MIFANTSIFYVVLGVIFLLLGSFLAYKNFQKNKNIFQIIFLIASCFFCFIALFSPRAGVIEDEKREKGGNVLFVMDLSNSMDVGDISTGGLHISRFQAQKKLISEFVKKYSENKFGLFAFSGDALEILPFTSDIGLFQTIVDGIDKNNISKQGSDFSLLFQKLESYTHNISEPTTFVIFTDGGEIENTKISQGFLQQIKEKNIELLFVGIGTKKGGKIPDGVDFYGRPLYKIYQGETVISQLNQQGIENFTDTYNGNAAFISDINKSEKIFSEIIKNLETSYIEKNISLSRDMSYIFIIFGLLSFLIFLFLEKYRH